MHCKFLKTFQRTGTRMFPCTKMGIFLAICIGKYHYLIKLRKGYPEAHKTTESWEINSQDGRYAVQAGRAVQQAADLEHRHGGIMRIRRALIIPAILALGVAGPAFSGSAMAVAAGHAPSVQVQVAAASGHPDTYYHI